ncbi:MAG: hypothetical protein C3F17_19235 [Bradyrhizobiaceae bacterium]|nr:MAG: hypothetical protein C3F17_19235 [Bradyrhizobiaceae bacterium]
MLGDLFVGTVADDSRFELTLDEPESASALVGRAPPASIQVSKGIGKTVRRFIPQQLSFEERIFDSLVNLKTAVATYAMHLPPEERHRIFERLDSVINAEDWHEEDPLPIVDSFKAFLQWLVFTNSFGWSSIGVSQEGTILVAWSRPHVAVTASFGPSGRVTWTARIEPREEGDEPDHAAGVGSLRSFAEHARLYLGGPGGHAGHEHP